ncbi:MAG: hypothetical protein QW753_07005 [Thermofilum sp.]
MAVKKVEFACQGFSIVVFDEGSFYAFSISRELDELCFVSQALQGDPASARARVSKQHFEERFRSIEAFVDWLADKCSVWKRASSLSAVEKQLRSSGWLTALSEEGLEALKIVEGFAVEARARPFSAVFSKVSAVVKAYPARLEEALLLKGIFSSEGFTVESLLPVVVASLRESVAFNCSIPGFLAGLEGVARRVRQRASLLAST